MKNPCFILLIVFLIPIISCKREEVKQYAAIETYPNDDFLNQVSPKKAMVIIAHDDDMCAMTGTLSKLNKVGWEIRILSLNKGENRNTAHKKACELLADQVSFMSLRSEDLYYNIDTNAVTYEAFPKSKFSSVFKIDTLRNEMFKHLKDFQPTIVFTLDHEFGGYGHPEHVLVSQMALELAQDSVESALAVYQSVFTDHMEKTIMARHKKQLQEWGFDGLAWERAKKAYHTDGMPEPTVQITITEEAEAKMYFLRSYNKHERKNLNFFIPAFEDYPANEYFEIFDREFYRAIKIK
jgi:N-acetylglucosamine malate deacetylase 2